MSRFRPIAVALGAALLWLWMACWYAVGRAAGVTVAIAMAAIVALQAGYRDGRWAP